MILFRNLFLQAEIRSVFCKHIILHVENSYQYLKYTKFYNLVTDNCQ